MNTASELESEVRRLIGAGDLRDAAVVCDRLNQAHPESASGWATASDLALRVGEPAIAVQAVDRALRLAPDKPALLLQKMTALEAAGDTGGAVATARLLGDHVFDNGQAASTCGLLLTRLQLFKQARSQFLRACELDPDNGEHYYNLATVERFLGDRDAAEDAINSCIALRPADAAAHLLRAGLRTQTKDKNNIQALLDAHALMRDLPRDLLQVCFALFKELEDTEDYERAFQYLEEGARLRRTHMQYTPENDLGSMREIRNVYTREVIEASREGHVSAEPIFIIGMPRTGTTLVERILGSHSVVRSAGESQAFAVELTQQCKRIAASPPANLRELVRLSKDVDFAALGAAYVDAARPVGEPTAHFIDKLPLNFLYAGLIHLALPKARIVMLDRDPMDTCFAVFKTLFAGIYPFSYDLGELANYVVEYRKLMNHWQEVMPGVMHVVRYEDLVTNPQPVIESLLDYCSLSYEDSCRQFFTNPDASTTASAVHVRSDVYTTSVGRWRNYERQLQPVADILEKAK